MKFKLKLKLKHFVARMLPTVGLFIAIFSILPHPSVKIPILHYLDITVVWWTILFSFFIIFYLSIKYFLDENNKKDLLVLNLYLFWILICIIRGVFVAEIYWDWKALVNNSMGLLLPIVIYTATNKVIVQSILSNYIKYGLPLFFILMFLIRTDAYGFYLIPVSFLLLFLPSLPNKQKILLLFFAAFVFGADFGARSNIIKFGLPLFVLIIYYFEEKISIKTLNYIQIVLFIVPVFFLTLGVTGVFNVFKVSDYLGEFKAAGTDIKGDRNTIDVTEDTRTFLYVEIIESAIKNDYWIFGRTPARGNDSSSFGPFYYELTGRDERWDNEIGVANVFTWTGIVGVFLYLFIFYRASYLAINRSGNIYAKMLGIFVALRWVYSWVEDVNMINLNYFMLCIMIGLCFSSSFRAMTNYEVALWARGIFDSRYLNFEKHRIKEDNGK